MTWFGAEWRRRHVWQHFVGGVVWVLILSFPPLQLTPWEKLLWTGIIQGVWERYQREYDPTYPVWSMIGDTVLALIGAAPAAFLFR